MERLEMIRKLGMLAAVLAALIIFSGAALAADLRYYALDVGQGDCSLFLFPNGQTMLIDAGIKDEGRRVANYLKSCGVKRIDFLVATHPHADHIGGMGELFRKFEIGEVWDSGFVTGSPLQDWFYRAVKKTGAKFGRPKRGYSRNIGDVLVEVLAPVREVRGTKRDINNNSIVLMVTYGDVKFLMAGDMEREQRATLPDLPRCTVLKAAHHGSYNGTDAAFLRKTQPKAVILSYAKDNDYGYPHREVVSAVKEARILRFDTADGTVKLRTDGKNLTYPKERVVN